MITLIRKLLSCPVAVFGGITLVSVFALAAALYSEVALDLEPCILCIYQRIPFVIGALFGIIGLALRKKAKVVNWILAALGVNFLINSGIAFYHTGVEQKWWVSAVEGCAVPNFGDSEPQSILEDILSAPTAACSEIPWQDPIIGLSMANYNVVLCFGIALACALSLIIRRKADA
ncbi:MAG: disulfide bond formation protein B [Alphaproteobacteria bacterium]|nr:disulfide bond formation protein B [Alphaproteobacteria bacterium]